MHKDVFELELELELDGARFKRSIILRRSSSCLTVRKFDRVPSWCKSDASLSSFTRARLASAKREDMPTPGRLQNPETTGWYAAG